MGQTMNLEETIFKRQSVRSYDDTPLNEETLNKIRNFIENIKPLNPNINWSYDIVGPENIKTLMRWKAPYYLLIYSEEKENYYQNIGFIFQQVDLYLQSNEIGSCWIGLASPKNYENKNKKQKYIIMISFGKSIKNIYRNDINRFKRKNLGQISDTITEKLIPAQLAPSATNSQPWYFKHNNDNCYDLYRVKHGIIKRKTLAKLNKIDIGITLSHLYISNKDTFKFYIKDKPSKLDNYYYEGTFEI